MAYTIGRDIVFAAGQYAPGTMRGKKLLAHEMTHVLQQSTNAAPSQIQFGGRDSDQYEREADAIAAQVVSTPSQARGLAVAPRIASDTPARLMRAPEVDLTLHHGSIPKQLLDAIKKYWCTPAGKDKVREMYLNTALTRQGSKIEPGFVSRRKHRVWPPSSG